MKNKIVPMLLFLLYQYNPIVLFKKKHASLCACVFLFAVLFFFFGCKSKKQIKNIELINTEQASKDTLDEKCKLDYKSGKTLMRLMQEQELHFKTAVGKFNCDVTISEEEHNVNVSVRCKKDSLIWLNISKIGLDIMRLVLTKDSVKFMIMVGSNKGYFLGDYSFINDTLHADLDYDMFQALLFGNSADFIMDSVKLKGGKDKNNCQYFLSTLRKRKLRKLMKASVTSESAQTIWINPANFKISSIEFDDAAMKRKFNAAYHDFQGIDNYTMPFKMIYTITAEKTIKAEISYLKMKLNEVISFPFRVPDSYEKIELKKKENNTTTDQEEELQMKYELAMKRGSDAMAVKTWDVAAAAFSEALTYKKDDLVATQKKKEAELKIKKESNH